MWPDITSRYLEAIRYDHAKYTRVVYSDPVAGATTTLADTSAGDRYAQILDGSVTVDATSNVRRTLNLTLAGLEATWDILDTVNGELTVTRGVRYTDGTVEWVPLGVFRVTQDALNYGSSKTLTITSAPDRWGRVQRATLPPTGRASVPSNTAWQEVQRLVEGAWSTGAATFPGWSNLDTTATTKAGLQLWDSGDREAAILPFLTANAVECFFDASGLAVLQPVPQLSNDSTPIWTIDAGVTGVLIDADRTRDRSRAYNVVIVSTNRTDVIFAPVEVENTDPADPLSVPNAGYQAIEVSLPVYNSGQARTAGLAILNKSVGIAKQLSMQALHNDALEAGDVVDVILPKTDANLPRPSELHILDVLTIPLTPTPMELQTRSTVPATLGA